MTTTLRRFRFVVGTILVLLVLQFAVGMVANLYVEFPGSLPHGEAWAWAFANNPVIPIHVVLGALIGLLGLVAIELSLWADAPGASASAVLGLVSTMGALLSGIWFMTYGQSNISSLCMALGFIGAVVAYGAGLLVPRRSTVPASRGRRAQGEWE